jgi:hypothetical protein
MSFAEKLEALNVILPDLVPLSAKTVKRSTIQSRRLLREEEKFLESGTVSTETALVRECKAYIAFMKDCSDENPLDFWTKHAHQFPILAVVARQILAIPAESSSTERLFSVGGRICTFDRASLKPANVDILTTLHVWEKTDLDQNIKSMVREAANNKFCEVIIDALTNSFACSCPRNL